SSRFQRCVVRLPVRCAVLNPTPARLTHLPSLPHLRPAFMQQRPPGALELLETHQLTALPFVLRHVSGDWGDICAEDRQSNADALQYGYRLMSVYVISKAERLWIITEADRSSTTLLLPEEY
ncbi:hypothetical protein, partial [Comamonas thiooxydans]|uniref:hypothetical protein n=1 Tax=Comamonas thiooxydans TaxID=363952 RepID=UPI00209BE02C